MVMSSKIMTHSGMLVDPFNLWPSDILIEDIAHALSNQCRFSGHSIVPYSVAQHSVEVSYVCDPLSALWGLLHDASEYVLVDIPTPLKRHLAFAAYREAEADVMNSVCIRFGLNPTMPVSVKEADEILLATEVRDFMPSQVGWSLKAQPLDRRLTARPSQEAKKLFLDRYYALVGTH